MSGLRIVFYVAVAFFVYESVVPANSGQKRPIQNEALSSDFKAWSATFPSRLDRAMETGSAE